MYKLSVDQRDEVDRLTEQVGRCRTVIDLILALAEQLKEATIEKVLAKTRANHIGPKTSVKIGAF
jgi:hypothetical protein